MTKLTTKNWVKVSINKKNKVIRFTKQFYKSQSEGLQMLSGKATNYAIINKSRLDKMIAEGYVVVGENKKEEWNPPYLVGGEIEEQIRQYVVAKKQRQAVQFVSGVVERNRKYAQTAREIFGETKFDKVEPIKMDSAWKKFERTEVGKSRMME